MSEETRTRVWLVKTPEDSDAVIVSFAESDSDECADIFLYEPGADPVELAAVSMDGVATEFEHATVTAVSGEEGTHDYAEISYPGDELIPLADSDSLVDRATEDHTALVAAYEELTEQTRALVDAVREEHRAAHESGPIDLCGYATCQAAREVDL